MKHYAKFLIAPTDKFDPLNYLQIEDEIELICEKTRYLPDISKPEIIISFLKDHTLESKWASVNPKLTELVTSGTLFSGNIQSLFDSCRNNPSFREGLEVHLYKCFEKNIQLQGK